MRRSLKVICIAGAAVAAGGTVWAIASSEMLGRYIQASTPERADPPRADKEKAPAVAVAAPQMKKDGSATGAREALAIEVARIEAGGASVLAGRSPPKHRVTVLANGREIATAVASEEGQWSIVLDSGISAGPLELTIKSSSQAGGPVVVGVPHKIVVPERAATQRVAAAPVERAAPPAAIAPKPAAAPQVVSAPSPSRGSAASPAVSAPSSDASKAASASPSRPAPAPATKSEDAADRRALERFAALVERARTEAATRQVAPAPTAPAPTATEAAPASPAPAAMPAPVATAPPSATVGATAPAASTPPKSGPMTIVSATPSPQSPGAPAAPVQVARAEQAPIPVPITFVTDRTTLTDNGTRAAALLAEYLRIKRPGGISLSGHADSRGPDRYNMELSRRRLEAIEHYLRQAGYTGSLILLPKGEREPFQGIDRTRVSRQEVYQADRRVELRLTQ